MGYNWLKGSRSPRGVAAVALMLGVHAFSVSAIAATGSATFGVTVPGGSFTQLHPDRKWANRYALTRAGAVTKLTAYLQATGASGRQVLRAVIYADSSGSPGRAGGA